jgi:hypothetical protein
MTSKERMLTAYRNEVPDCVPVSPELWYDIPLLVSGVPYEEVCLGNHPLWQIQLQAHEHFGSDAWIVPFPGRSAAGPEATVESHHLDKDTLEIRYTFHTSRGDLARVTRNTDSYYDWAVEHPVKDFLRDMPGWEEVVLADPRQCNLTEIREALAGTGEQGLVTAYVGKLFYDVIASAREGASTQALYDLFDYREYLQDLQARYVEFMREMAAYILAETDPDVLFVENGYSSIGIISPALYREWDVPVIQAVSEVAKQHGKLLHVHQHGPAREVLGDLVEAGVDLVDPLERPPSGDVADLGAVKREWGSRLALRGNIDAHNVLLRGTPQDVENQVKECLAAAAPGGGYILATGDGTIVGTPFRNVEAMVEAGRKYGKYPQLLDV